MILDAKVAGPTGFPLVDSENGTTTTVGPGAVTVDLETSPPSYDTLVPNSAHFIQGKTGYGYSHAPTSPTSPGLGSCSSPGGGGRVKSSKSWFNFAALRTTREVQTTVLGLVRDLVREHYADSAAPAGILQSCAAACGAHDLNLSALLQEKSIEGHTPLYWAIVKRRPDEQLDADTEVPDLLTALLSHTTPLTPETIADIRLACLVTSDQRLFQRLRMSREFATVSGTEQMLLGATQTQDEIEVREVAADDGSFVVELVVPSFQKRMMVTGKIELEFIARSRLWKLSFVVATPNQFEGIRADSWCVAIELQPHSPPTWLDAGLVIEDPNAYSTIISSESPDADPPIKTISSNWNAKPPLGLRLSTNLSQLEAPRGTHHKGTPVVVAIEDTTATTLQYSGTPYIASDEKLRARFDAKLRKPAATAECIIC